jgi:ABC-type oligopeptide transport system substrate-binding subunit
MKRLVAVLLAAALALPAADMSKTLRVAFPVDVTGFDPQVTQDLYSAYIERAVFDSPLTYDYLART